MGITTELETILNARYGRDVRQAIHDGIKQAYDDAIRDGNANMEVSQARGSYATLAERLTNLDKVDRDNLNELMVLLAGRINKGQVTMADLTQEVREVLNGDRPLPIVGKDSVIGYENIVKGTVTPMETSFLKLDETVNMFGGSFQHFYLKGASGSYTLSDLDGHTVILKLEPNTDVSISMLGGSNVQIKALIYDRLIELNETVQPEIFKESRMNFLFNTGATGKYLYMSTTGSDGGIPPFVKIVKSNKIVLAKGGENYPIVPNNISVYSKDEIDKQLSTIVKPINLFNGKWHEGYALFGTHIDFTLKDTTNNRRVAIVPVLPNTTYSVNLGSSTFDPVSGYYYFKVGTTNLTVEEIESTMYVPVTDFVQKVQYGDDTRSHIFTTGPTEKSLIILAGAETSPYMEVVEGATNILVSDSYDNVKYKLSSSVITDANDVAKETCVFFGDSIVQLNQLPHLVGQMIGSDVVDVSFAGAALTRHQDSNMNAQSVLTLTEQIIANDFTQLQNSLDSLENSGTNVSAKRINASNLVGLSGKWSGVSKVIILAGTNNFAGTPTNPTDFESDIKTIIQNFYTINPKIEIYFITPPFRWDSWAQAGSRYDGVTLIQLIDTIISTAKGLNIPVYDLYRNGGVNEFNVSQYLKADMLHQNNVGDMLFAEKISKFITSN